MNIAIFADLHGRISLAFKLCARWEQETGEKLDLILQAGDMGIFPYEAHLDKATIRHAQQDTTELGFMNDFAVYTDEIATILAQTECNLLFVRGNHEDHLWLDLREQQEAGSLFPVDAYQRLYCLKTGVPYTYTTNKEHLSILGIGRIGPQSQQLKNINIQPYEQARLQNLGDISIDILLTHDMPIGISSRSQGMAEITTTLHKYRPAYHFYGHIGREYSIGISDNKATRFCKLADLEWHDTSQVVHPNSMAILRWTDRTTHSLDIVHDGWYSEYTAHTWRYL